MDSPSNGAVRFGPFELDTRAGCLRKGKTQLHLQPQPFKLLSLLVSRAGQLVTREEIQHQLWDKDTFVDFEQSLNVRRVSTTLRQVPTKFSEFFLVLGFVQENFAPGSPSNDDRQLGRPIAFPFLPFLKRISLLQSGSLRFLLALPQEAAPEWKPAC